MVERRVYCSPKVQVLKFVQGAVFKGPEENGNGKFVRIGKMFVVCLNEPSNHTSLVDEKYGGAAGGRFLRVAQMLADANSAALDAGWMNLSLRTKRIILYAESFHLCNNPRHTVPLKREAREKSGEVLQALCPGFEVEVRQPDYFSR